MVRQAILMSQHLKARFPRISKVSALLTEGSFSSEKFQNTEIGVFIPSSKNWNPLMGDKSCSPTLLLPHLLSVNQIFPSVGGSRVNTKQNIGLSDFLSPSSSRHSCTPPEPHCSLITTKVSIISESCPIKD